MHKRSIPRDGSPRRGGLFNADLQDSRDKDAIMQELVLH